MRLRTALFVLFLTASASAQGPVGTSDDRLNLQPSATPAGGSGLWRLQTVPTNPTGTLGIAAHGFLVEHAVPQAEYALVTTGMLGLTYSLTRDLEGYLSASFFAGAHTANPDMTLASTQYGLGSQEIGMKYRFPLKRSGLLQMGATAGFILGTAETKVTGFNFLNTRRDSDVKLRALQTLRFQDRYGWPNLHLNEGYLTQYGSIPDLLMLGLGTDYLLDHKYQFMAEFETLIEQKTPLYLNENYMTVTAAVRYYPSSTLSFLLGGTFGLSKERHTDESWRRSDPWMMSLGLTFTPQVSSSDRDWDGVPDWLDAELNLPADYPRDALGQVLDTDMDGVPDPYDKEPSSIRGAVVDPSGVALDSDSDGVPNGLDRQTRTPDGAWVDAYGIALDSDCDGVPDGLDEEPSTRPGTLVDARGISKDGDGDGVPDGLDQEANSPAGALVDAWGRSMTSPLQAAAQPTVIQRLETDLMRISDVHFEPGSARIRPEDYSTLDIVGQAMEQLPNLVILVEGHADSTGSAERNQELSIARARAVRDYLLARFSALSRANFTVTGLGERDPLADDGSLEGRVQNRRVEFKILNRDAVREMITTWE